MNNEFFPPKQPKGPMSANRLRRLIDMGLSATIIRADGSEIKYSPMKDGHVVVSYKGEKTCMYCGAVTKTHEHGFCPCDKEFELKTLTGMFYLVNRVQVTSWGYELDRVNLSIVVREK